MFCTKLSITFIVVSPTSNDGFVQKESVRLFVYCAGALTKPETNKQHPTPAVYTLEQYMTMQVMRMLSLLSPFQENCQIFSTG